MARRLPLLLQELLSASLHASGGWHGWHHANGEPCKGEGGRPGGAAPTTARTMKGLPCSPLPGPLSCILCHCHARSPLVEMPVLPPRQEHLPDSHVCADGAKATVLSRRWQRLSIPGHHASAPKHSFLTLTDSALPLLGRAVGTPCRGVGSRELPGCEIHRGARSRGADESSFPDVTFF